jgi:ATP:corrinoid adenosyltransferase
MAYMIPMDFSKNASSSGERFIFEQLRDAPDSDKWVCLHSLELSRHTYKVCSEIDFVVMVPGEGVFCLEVKSGGVYRINGEWLYEDWHGNVRSNSEGPFDQSQNAMFSLLDRIQKTFTDRLDPEFRLNNLIYGWGVVLPDVEFKDTEREFESWRVYDVKSRQHPINQYIKRLSRHCHQKTGNLHTAWYNEKESRPTPTDVKRLRKFLRGDLVLPINKSIHFTELHEDIIRLTEEQTDLLENLRDNPRIFITGAAGTGKTVLAVEFAKREAAKGKRVLFLCYNKLLCQRLKAQLSEHENRITAETFHNYVAELILRSSLKDTFIAENIKVDDDTRFTKVFPRNALRALKEEKEKPFDVLVLDECQDLLMHEYLPILDKLVAGGVEDGHWVFFGDTHFQNLFNNKVTLEQMIAEIENRSIFAKFGLHKNCRNTMNIGKDIYRIVGFEKPPFRESTVPGPPVEYRYYQDPSEQTNIIAGIVRELDTEGIKRDDITVLSKYKFENSSFADQKGLGKSKFCDMTAGSTCRDQKNGINFCTIQAFKGLENSVIIVTDISEIDKDHTKSLIYVAMSRAIIKLFVLLPINLKQKVEMALNS